MWQVKVEQNMKENKSAPAAFCPLPWSHINIKSNGTYRLCAHGTSSGNRGVLKDKTRKPLHIKEVDWNTVMNSNLMKTVRKNMLQGKWSSECIRCKKEFLSGRNSHNFAVRTDLAEVIGNPKDYPGYLKAKKLTSVDGTINLADFPISFLGIQFGNSCNLKCVMCSPISSSSWYREHSAIWEPYFKKEGNTISTQSLKEFTIKSTVEKKSIFNWSDDPNLWHQFKKYIHQFRKVYITGGEPLLTNSCYNFLEWCVENDIAKNLEIECSSNITYVPERIWKLWRKFKKLHFGISLDGFGEVNSFIRYPSKWSHIEKNISLIDKMKEHNFIPSIVTTVSVLNVWHLPEFIDYLISKNYNQIGKFDIIMNPHPVHKPHYLNINILEESFKEKIRQHFEKYKRKISSYDWQSVYGDSLLFSWEEKIKRACHVMDWNINFMYQIAYSKKELQEWRKRFIYYMDRLDVLRGLCWKETFPELYESTLKWRKIQ